MTVLTHIHARTQRLKQNDAGHEHIYILQNMESPDAPRIKEIESLTQSIHGTQSRHARGDPHLMAFVSI